MNTTSGNFEVAARILIEDQLASISYLQRRMRVGYQEALGLMDSLIEAGIVIRDPKISGQLHLSPPYQNRHRKLVTGDERALYIDKVIETVLFFFEMHEEKCDGHTSAIDLIKPAHVSNTALRNFVLKDCFAQGYSFSNTAISLDSWLRDQSLVLPTVGQVTSALRIASAAYERAPVSTTDQTVRLWRSCLRLARYYRLMYVYGTAVNNESRCADYFVPWDWIRPQAKQGWHPEHVVPLAFIRDWSIEKFSEGWSVVEIAKLVKDSLLIIDIQLTERDTLDMGEDNLKSTMPLNWEPVSGCIYERLHKKNIAFKPVDQYPCVCPTAHCSTT